MALWSHTLSLSGGYLNKWSFMKGKNPMLKNGGIIFELMGRDYNTSRLRCRSYIAVQFYC